MDQHPVEKATQVLDEITNLITETTDGKLCEAYSRIQRRLNAEVKFLKEGKQKNRASSNLPYLLGVYHAVRNSTNVDQVICDMRKHNIIIDVICDCKKTWKKVIARNPQALHLIWAGNGQYGGKDVIKKIKRHIEAAKKESEFSPPKIVCVFANGVTEPMAEYLQGLNVQVEGERVPVSEDTKRRLQMTEEFSDTDEDEWESSGASDYESDKSDEESNQQSTSPLTGRSAEIAALPTEKKIFLDVTSLVIFVSDVCNGWEHFEFKDTEMKIQAEQERKTPVMDMMKPYFDDCLLVTCEAALSNFKSFMKLLGGEEENIRAEELISRLTVVPDNMSPRFTNIIKRGKVTALHSSLLLG